MMADAEAIIIHGDDSGPELIRAARAVVDCALAIAGRRLNWIPCHAGQSAVSAVGEALPWATVDAIRDIGVALKGPTTTEMGSGHRSVNVRLRQELELFACVRPCRGYSGVPCLRSDIDVTVVRENTEDIYAGYEFEPNSDGHVEVAKMLGSYDPRISSATGVTLRAVSAGSSLRVARFAFDLAERSPIRRVVAGGLPRVFECTDETFLAAARSAHREHPDVDLVEYDLVDLMGDLAAGALSGVVVLPNYYGDVASDIAAATVGGLGVAPGANHGPNCAVFEATHGSAPQWAGSDLLNPTALILSAAMLLDHLGLSDPANLVRLGVLTTLRQGTVTSDLAPGGLSAAAGIPTTQFVESVKNVMLTA